MLDSFLNIIIFTSIGMPVMAIGFEAMRARQERRFYRLAAAYLCYAIVEVAYTLIGQESYFARVLLNCLIGAPIVAVLCGISAGRITGSRLAFWLLALLGVVYLGTTALYIDELASGRHGHVLILASVNIFATAGVSAIFLQRAFGDESSAYHALLLLWLFQNFAFSDPAQVFNRFFTGTFYVTIAATVLRRLAAAHRNLLNHLHLQTKARDIVYSMLHELSTTVKGVSSLEQTLDCVLATTTKTTGAEGAGVFQLVVRPDGQKRIVFTKAAGDFWPVHSCPDIVFTKRKYAEHALGETLFELGQGIVGLIAQRCEPVSLEVGTDAAQMKALGMSTRAIHTIAAVPLMVKEQLLGVMVVQNKLDDTGFNANDMHLLQAVADQTALSMNNLRIYAELAEGEKIRQEMQIAARIQQSLLPAGVPVVENLQIAAFMRPAKDVGGDYYDFLPWDGHNLGVVIGDVSGKGLPAGMIMIIAHTLLHAVAVRGASTRDIMLNFSREMYGKMPSGSFMTMNFLLWEGEQRALHYTGAGHEHLLWYHGESSAVERVKAGGLALGLLQDSSPYVKQSRLDTKKGDVVVLYTDGVTESVNQSKERFSLDRLVHSLELHATNEGVESIKEAILKDVFDYMGDTEQYDDITLLVMRVQ